MSMVKTIKRLIKKSPTLICLGYLVLDFYEGMVRRLGRVSAKSGDAHALMNIDQSLSYIETVYNDYLKFGKIEHFNGSVVEIGPGDNFGVGLLMLNGGAEKVIAVDRFYSKRDQEQQNRIYDAMVKKYGIEKLFSGVPSENTIRNLNYEYGIPAEEYFKGHTDSFHAIVSRAVLEHLMDPISMLNHGANALKPGGTMVHEIDLRDHGMFAGHHPLTFLTVPNFIYSHMVRNGGRPNRVLINDYQNWIKQSGLAGKILIKGLVGVEQEFDPAPWDEIDQTLRNLAIAEVKKIRPHLAREFRNLPDENLAASIIIVCK